jgi:hypothetical protein
VGDPNHCFTGKAFSVDEEKNTLENVDECKEEKLDNVHDEVVIV